MNHRPTLVLIPGAPLLVPRLTAGDNDALRELRAATRRALTTIEHAPLVVVVADPQVSGFVPMTPPQPASLNGFGASVATSTTTVHESSGPEPLDSSAPADVVRAAAVAASLCGIDADGGADGHHDVDYVRVGFDGQTAGVAEFVSAFRYGHYRDRHLIVVADGSACRGPKPPRGVHPDAEHFDREVARAISKADGDALADIDAEQAGEVCATGAPGFRLVGAWCDTFVDCEPRIEYDAAPYGVGYIVAVLPSSVAV